ncbi:30S ribosomal protein S9, partial [Candidatus Woesearchaeota archaeon CG_4_10_14_0_8_um_filter_47_5]
MKVVHTSGKRKRAIARATLFPGSGVVRINSKLLNFVTPQ